MLRETPVFNPVELKGRRIDFPAGSRKTSEIAFVRPLDSIQNRNLIPLGDDCRNRQFQIGKG